MIHTLLNLTRSLFILDTETTGLSKDARIIELGFQQWTHDGMIKEWRSLINPQIPIPPAATEIHGITDLDMQCCQLCKELPGHRDHVTTLDSECHPFKVVPTFKQLGPSLLRGFHDCDYAGKNIRFDLKKLYEEFKRNGFVWSYEGARIIDADRLEALAKPRNLEAMHETYTGAKHDGAHGALSDVRAVATVIVKQLETHAILSRDLDALHAAQWPGWLTAGGEFRLTNGVPIITFGKYGNKPMQQIPNDYYDFLIKNDFPKDVKTLAANAKMGKYPEVTAAKAKAADKRMEI